MRWRGRAFLLLALGILSPILLGGCVYLRFVQLKRQLAEPAHYLSLENRSSLTLSFRKPVLHPGDILHVAGRLPTHQREDGEETRWTYAFLKETPHGTCGSGPYDVPVDLFFRHGKLGRGRLPDRFARVLDSGLLLRTLRALGRARVEVRTRAVRCRIPAPEMERAALRSPSRNDLLHILGPPSRETKTGEERRLVYRYTLKPDPSNTQRAPSRSRATFVFGSTGMSLVRAEFRFAGITLLLQYPPPTNLLRPTRRHDRADPSAETQKPPPRSPGLRPAMQPPGTPGG